MTHPLTNWAGNLAYRATQLHQPATLEALQALVAGSRKVRALGTRHSFSTLADTDADLVSLERLPPVLAVDQAAATVTVSAGRRYGEVGRALHPLGLALPNLASLPHISVAGACATATHGSGQGLGNLATAVIGLELIIANGERVRLTRERDGQLFAGAVVGLGALGVVTELTLALVPAFSVRQYVYENLPLAAAADHFDAIQASGYSVSLFTDWQAPRFTQVWVKQRVDGSETLVPPPTLFGATPAREPRHPIAGLGAENCTEQLGMPGPWHERLPHFRLEFTPSSGAELQAEYIVPRQHAVAALAALDAIRGQIAPLLQVCEVRTVAADDLWLSSSYQQDSVCFHFTLLPDWPAARALLPVIEAALAPYAPRPHWGKLFTLAPEAVRARYPRLADFRTLAERWDPEGKFRNAFVDAYVWGTKQE